jgi:Icc-related predicted phosphoesterase
MQNEGLLKKLREPNQSHWQHIKITSSPKTKCDNPVLTNLAWQLEFSHANSMTTIRVYIRVRESKLRNKLKAWLTTRMNHRTKCVYLTHYCNTNARTDRQSECNSIKH